MKALILKAILAMQPVPSPAWEETTEQYVQRMELTAEAISQTAPNSYWGIATAIVFHGESRFSPRIHAGERLGDMGQAICMGQHHRNGRTEPEWLALAGSDLEATKRCALATVRALQRADRWCRARQPQFASDLTGAFAMYGTGSQCDPHKSKWGNILKGRAKSHGSMLRRFGLDDRGRLVAVVEGAA